MAKKQMFIPPFKTSISNVYSLEMCRVSDSKVLLTAVGYSPKYSNSESDVFDVTKLLDFHKVKYDSETQEESENNNDSETEDRGVTHKESTNKNLNNFEHILELVFEKVEKLVGKMVNDKFQKLQEKILKDTRIRNNNKNNEDQEMVETSKSEITKKLVEIIKKYKTDFMGKCFENGELSYININ
jgi:hypothetical protein